MKRNLVIAIKLLQGNIIGNAYITRWFDTFGRKYEETGRCMHDPDKYSVKELIALLEEVHGIKVVEDLRNRVLTMSHDLSLQDCKDMFLISGPGASDENPWTAKASEACEDLRTIRGTVQRVDPNDADVSVKATDTVYGDQKALTQFTDKLKEDLEKENQEQDGYAEGKGADYDPTDAYARGRARQQSERECTKFDFPCAGNPHTCFSAASASEA